MSLNDIRRYLECSQTTDILVVVAPGIKVVRIRDIVPDSGLFTLYRISGYRVAVSSTSPPGGNQVDGLPPVSS